MSGIEKKNTGRFKSEQNIVFEQMIEKKCKWKVIEKQQQKIWCENKEQTYTYYSKNTREKKNRRAKCSQKFPK